MHKYYRLSDNNEVEECDADKCEEFLLSGRKIIKQEDVGDYWVSTVFLCIDHNWGFREEKRPVVFETMIKNKDKWENYQERYCTYADALNGHNAVVEKLKQGLSLNDQEL